jgi:hypothetical protein
MNWQFKKETKWNQNRQRKTREYIRDDIRDTLESSSRKWLLEIDDERCDAFTPNDEP